MAASMTPHAASAFLSTVAPDPYHRRLAVWAFHNALDLWLTVSLAADLLKPEVQGA